MPPERRGVDESSRVLAVSHDISASHWIASDDYEEVFVRGRVHQAPVDMSPDSSPLGTAVEGGAVGVVINCSRGVISLQQLFFARRALRSGLRVWCCWIFEDVVEAVDKPALRRYAVQWLLAAGVVSLRAVWRSTRYVRARLSGNAAERLLMADEFRAIGRWFSSLRRSQADDARQIEVVAMIKRLRADPKPMPPRPLLDGPTDRQMTGKGAYLRLDYWAAMIAGGSYTHTCFVAKELAAQTQNFTAYVANEFGLLDEFEVDQFVLPRPEALPGEEGILVANAHYMEILRREFEKDAPAYIYERYCLGNIVGAALSRELNIPYILEYNGSEISMSKSFSGIGYALELVFKEAEDFSLAQATFIVVVSSVLRDQLVERGIDRERIIVNPNGVDTDIFKPADQLERQNVPNELQWPVDSFVIGFIGTFGGWHGISVLADALPEIAKRCPRARFLLVGDGTERAGLERRLKSEGVGGRVHFTGIVEPSEGRRLLGGCDLFLSPHDRHMKDSPFFGSPTKLFEYMSLEKPIVASDLEQIGAVLRPALHADEIVGVEAKTGTWRGVLCEPGNARELAEAVVKLAADPELCRTLGENARKAAQETFSWQANVARVLNAKDGGALLAGKPGEPRRLDYAPPVERPGANFLIDNNSWLAVPLRKHMDGASTILDATPPDAEVTVDPQVLQVGSEWVARKNLENAGPESVDAIFGYAALSGSDAPNELMEDALRCLKKGGSLFLVEFAERSFFYWYSICLWRGLRWAWAYHKSFGTLLEELDDSLPDVPIHVRRALREDHVRGILRETKDLTFEPGPPDAVDPLPVPFVPKRMRSRLMIISCKKS